MEYRLRAEWKGCLMPVAAVFRGDKLVVASSFTLQFLDTLSVSPGIQNMIERASGEQYPGFVATDKTASMMTGTTPQLATILGAVGVGGLLVSGNTDFYHKATTAVANVARATASHHRIRAAAAIVYWTKITLPNQGRGTVEFMVCPAYDGSNEPLVYAGGVALSGSIDATAGAFFQCGPVYLNTTQYNQIQEIVIESGVKEVPKSSDGEHHATLRLIESIEPKITFKGTTALGLNSPGPGGLALDGTDGITCYARKLTASGNRVANATEEHIAFVGAAGRAVVLDSRAVGTSDVEETVEVTLIDTNDTANILAIDTTAAIP
jgi:hypothetical protein